MILLLALLACTDEPLPDFDWPALVPGAPVAGAAELPLLLPMGSPLGGYTARCACLGETASSQDNRASAYTRTWAESTGIQTRPGVKVLWLENGDDHLVWARAEVIYSFDNLIVEVTEQLEALTGHDLDGKVILAANHSHSSYANFADMAHFYLGGDYYNEEIFQRFAATFVDAAMSAYESREPVALGTSWTRDWDPTDLVYRDRRGENDELAVWDDVEPGYGKDPYVHMLRVDTLDGLPMALLATFGIHGTILGEDSSMVSVEAPGHVELALQERFDRPVVVMQLQGSGGDASPAGRGRDYERLESIGEYAADRLLQAWEDTPVSSEPILLEVASRHIPEDRDLIRVTRNGTMDLHYSPWVDDRYYAADDLVYDTDGSILSPIDEFNVRSGAAFCGSEIPLIPGVGTGSSVPPYSSCVDVEPIGAVVKGVFDLEDEEMTLPMREDLEAGTTLARLGPIPTLLEDGSEVSRELFAGFFPGETTAMFTEQWRRRVKAELGHEMPLLVGYAQDHEGYLLIPEDWLAGGYEPEINVWGPLQGEHIMEGVLEYGASVLGNDVREPADPIGSFAPTEYLVRELPTAAPDTTPEAGTRITEPPEYLWTPLDRVLDLDWPTELERVDGVVQLAWFGGDPGVDNPRVVLEHEQDGGWVEALTPSGRPITEALPDILLAWTPDPLYPEDVVQEHLWWASWQAVGPALARMSLPLGTYRLRVDGKRYTGGDTTWPWSTADYSFTTDSFELLPATLSIERSGDSLLVSVMAPEDGWRLVALDGDAIGRNPVIGELTARFQLLGGGFTEETAVAFGSGDRGQLDVNIPVDAVSVQVSDAHGNLGALSL